MEPGKFEKHIKNRLGERKIEPSSRAWNAIADQLGEPKHKKSKKFFRYGIAASFIGILIAVTLYVGNQNIPIETDVKVVETPIGAEAIEKQKTLPKEQVVQEDKVAISEGTKFRPKKKIKAEINVLPNSNDRITSVAPEQINAGKAAHTPESELMDAKIAELVAQVDFLERKNQIVSEAEVDSLLRKAQQEILAEDIFSKEAKVDADAVALLNEVEEELDQSFREQIFETLKTGFLKVRTAVADRNN